ncbi:MAG: hypothetical protein WCG27_06590 [Pseudomonadota bacterium]
MRPRILFITLLLTMVLGNFAFAKDFQIYSVVQNLPMGVENEAIKKNFYINMGSGQGLKTGSTLDVYRIISELDPYESKKRYNHKVKIGELKVIHAEETSAITTLAQFRNDENAPVLDVAAAMIGDVVAVKVGN